MPRGLNTYTTCAGPDKARPHQKIGGLAGLLINSWLSNGFLTVTAIAAILGISLGIPYALCAEAILVIGALKAFKRWYYHERLLCLGSDQCAIGTVVSPTVPPATDGDIKLNLLLAPYTRKEAEDTLFTHLENNTGMLSDPSHPIWNDWLGESCQTYDSLGNPIYVDSSGREAREWLPDVPGAYVYLDDGSHVPAGTSLARKIVPCSSPYNITEVLEEAWDDSTRRYDRNIIQKYMDNLKGIRKDAANVLIESNAFNQITLGVVDTLLLDTNMNSNDRIVDGAGIPIMEAKNYQQHYYRKPDSTMIEHDTWFKIPIDYGYPPSLNWQAPNAHSTYTDDNPQTGNPNENLNPMFRFGHRDEDADKSVAMVPYLHCEIEGNALEILLNRLIDTFIAFTIGCGIGGPVIGVVVALLVYFFKWLYDKITGKDGNAGDADVYWDDPLAEEGEPHESSQDTVVIWGDWIMDTEHQQYFEIHPVRAYYILKRHTEGKYPDFAGESDHDEWDSRKEIYPVEQITRTVARDMCSEVTKNEPPSSPNNKQNIKMATALSYGMTTQYG